MRLGTMTYLKERAEFYETLHITAQKCTFNLEDGVPEWDEAEWEKFTRETLEVVCDLRFHHTLLAESRLPSLYEAFCRKAAETCPFIREWVLWEEPNCPVLAPSNTIRVYSDLLKAGYSAIKEVNPTAKVYHGGMGVYAQTFFVQDLFAADALDYTDAINLHPFVFVETFSEFKRELNRLFDELRVWEKPIVITEWGVPSAPEPRKHPSLLPRFIIEGGCPSPKEDDQAEWLVWGLEKFLQEGVELVCLIPFDQDPPQAVRHWSHTCGLLREDFSEKPAYWRMKEFVETHY